MPEPESVIPPASEFEAAAEPIRVGKLTQPTHARRPAPRAPVRNTNQRILFLGNSYSPFSLMCFQALLEVTNDIFLGLYDPLRPGLWHVGKQRLKLRGWDFVLRKAWSLVQSKMRTALRRVGVPLANFSTLAELCSAVEINAIRCANPNSPEFVERVRALGVDLIVVANFNRILKSPLLNTPRLGAVNVHPSLLPQYRGPCPMYWVLANGEKSTGVTIHYIDEGIDSGDIIEQRKVEIRADETQKTLSNKCISAAASLLHEVIPSLLAGRSSRTPQDHSSASYYSWPPKGVGSM